MKAPLTHGRVANFHTCPGCRQIWDCNSDCCPIPEVALCPREHYTDEGLRVLLAEDWCIYVVRESDGLVFAYNTELWQQWRGFWDYPVAYMIPVAHEYRPRALAKSTLDYFWAANESQQMTLDEWLAQDQGAVPNA